MAGSRNYNGPKVAIPCQVSLTRESVTTYSVSTRDPVKLKYLLGATWTNNCGALLQPKVNLV